MRILWVVPRYGSGIVGGAETLVRALAMRAAPAGWDVEVATTCAVDHHTWADALPAGTTTEDGLRVHRFPVGRRDAGRYDALHARVVAGVPGYADELEWLANSVTSPAMEAYLERTAPERDLMLFAPYLFGTTLWGAQVDPERSALMPCLHDEPYARLRTVARVMEGTRGCLFNAPGEERLARGMFRIPAGGVVGMGFDPPGDPPAARSPLDGDYVVYAGRLEEGKRVHVAVEWAMRHRREDPHAPRLLLLGHGSYRPPAGSGDAVVVAGFVDEQTKRAAYAGAVAVVNPSHMESLSLVLLEGWREGAPAVVAAGSEVMRDHCERSGGGFAVEGYEAYRQAVSALRDDPDLRRRMGAAGGEYVQDVYGWPAVRARFRETVEALAA